VPVEQFGAFVTAGSNVLELGMGPGTDLLLLNQKYRVTGSDYSDHFLSHFRLRNPDIPLLRLDAETITTVRCFDAVYSNKVLHHLSPEQLENSIKRQREVVRKGGLLFHTFWIGTEKRREHDLCFNRYLPEDAALLFASAGKVVAIDKYPEMNADDSFYIAVKT
jgi:cyclopropane fatty-acyl-phospholipid synthase-like methyltransferase